MTALHAAAVKGYEKVISLLVQAMANFSIPDSFGGTALHLAAGAGHLTAVKILVAAGCRQNGKSPRQDAY